MCFFHDIHELKKALYFTEKITLRKVHLKCDKIQQNPFKQRNSSEILFHVSYVNYGETLIFEKQTKYSEKKYFTTIIRENLISISVTFILSI